MRWQSVPAPCNFRQLRATRPSYLGNESTDAFARAGDNMRGDQAAETLHLGFGCINGGANSGHVALDHHRGWRLA